MEIIRVLVKDPHLMFIGSTTPGAAFHAPNLLSRSDEVAGRPYSEKLDKFRKMEKGF